MEKYLSLVKTVMSPHEFSRTKYIVDEFCKTQAQGHELQEHLLKRQQGMDNWANDLWIHDMYLNIQVPLTINSNAAAMFPYQAFPSQREQLRFTAKFVRGLLDFKRLTDTRTLPIERCRYKEKGQPMCMEQHYRLFTSYREPGRERDVMRSDTGTPGRDFIIVACRNQFYKVDVIQEGQELSEADIFLQLNRVMTSAQQSVDKPAPVGILTSQARNIWAEHRERLLQDATNRANLFALENCLFLVCLDLTTLPSGRDGDGGMAGDMAARTHQILHGQGVERNTANRWMDKTVQFIVAEDGTCGVNMEHSVVEGIALCSAVEHAFSVMGKDNFSDKICDPASLALPKCLQWNLTTQSLRDIEVAKENVARLVDDFDLAVFRFPRYGREFIKAQGMSPDAYIQLALQLTYYKIHGCLTSTYESASVRRYRHGRVDNIRANSPAALAWIKAMLGQTEATDEDKRRLLTEAVQWQQDNMLETILGHGTDLHILGLREAAAELGLPTPDLFQDASYKAFNCFKLSTSQVPMTSDFWMGYGAVVPDGYGCCYNPQAPDSIVFSVASFLSCYDTSSEMFTQSLESSLLQMAEICTVESDVKVQNPNSKER